MDVVVRLAPQDLTLVKGEVRRGKGAAPSSDGRPADYGKRSSDAGRWMCVRKLTKWEGVSREGRCGLRVPGGPADDGKRREVSFRHERSGTFHFLPIKRLALKT